MLITEFRTDLPFELEKVRPALVQEGDPKMETNSPETQCSRYAMPGQVCGRGAGNVPRHSRRAVARAVVSAERQRAPLFRTKNASNF